MATLKVKHIPNVITLLRVALMPLLLYFLLQKYYITALIIFMIAGASDGLDGYLAKKFQWQSRFGSIADPLADKLLMLVSYGYLTYAGFMPLWLFFIVFGRDIFIVSAAISFHIFLGPFEMKPTLTSKFNTLMQIILVTYVMYSLVFIHIPVSVTEYLIVTVGITSVVSGLQYVWIGYQTAKQRIELKKVD